MDFELTPNFKNKELAAVRLKNEILSLNEKSQEYGLSLSEQDAIMLIEQGKEAIHLQERIEFGKSITTKLIEKFMQSTYITQKNYAQTIAILLDVFYEAKGESLDVLTDDEVIEIMYDFFENESGGDIDTLQGRDMYYLCRKIRNMATGIPEDEDEATEEPDE